MRVFILFLVLYVNFGESVILECNFEDDPHLGYMCGVQNENLITSGDDREITAISGQHQDGKSNDDVVFFFSDFLKLNYFPRGLTKFFKNIRKIQIGFASIGELTNADLEQFGDKLKEFFFYGNHLEVIKADLFKFNKNLEKVSFLNNRIRIVESGAFNGLDKLDGLWLGINKCVNKDVVGRNEVLNLIKIAEEKCKIQTKA